MGSVKFALSIKEKFLNLHASHLFVSREKFLPKMEDVKAAWIILIHKSHLGKFVNRLFVQMIRL